MRKYFLIRKFIVVIFLLMSLSIVDCFGYYMKLGKWGGSFGNSPLAKFLNRTLYNVSGGGWNGCGYFAMCAGLNPSSGKYSRADALAIRKIVYPDVDDSADCRNTNTAFSTSNQCAGKIAKELGVVIAFSGLETTNNEEVTLIYRKDGSPFSNS
jgi:hypothetical protein